jgi:hypothetical protein
LSEKFTGRLNILNVISQSHQKNKTAGSHIVFYLPESRQIGKKQKGENHSGKDGNTSQRRNIIIMNAPEVPDNKYFAVNGKTNQHRQQKKRDNKRNNKSRDHFNHRAKL